MDKEVQIKQILDFLENKNYDFKFTGNKEERVAGFSTLFHYKENSLTFVSSLNKFSDYKHMFKDRKIQLVITDQAEELHEEFNNVIQIDQPKSKFFLLLEEIFTENDLDNKIITKDSKAYNKNSYISKNAFIGENVKIGYGCVIEDNVIIGDNTVIHHNVVIKSNTSIGQNCSIFSGTVIGERGYNPLTSLDGTRNMLEHYGGVTIEDNVHIGDNCCIIRGAIDDTIISEGVKINTLAHIAHNCEIGRNTVITANTRICGSVNIGENCHIAANVIRNQCRIGDNATLGLGAVVVKDVKAGETVVGNPARPLKK